MNLEKMEEFKTNIVKWYSFEKDSKLLQIGKNDNITEELKKNCKIVKVIDELDLAEKEKFDYILIYGYEKHIEELEKYIEFLNEKGKIIIIGNNEFGINVWSRYDEILKLEENEIKRSTIRNIRKKLKENLFENINTFYVFPNYQMAEVIINEKTKISNSYIEKYNANLKNNQLKIFNENNVLKNILQNDSDMIDFFANSYFIVASKDELSIPIQSVTYNNCRKEEYRLITIVGENIVKKVPSSNEAQKHINNMAQIINNIKKENIDILDYTENGMIYSKYMKGTTLDEILNSKYSNFDYIIGILNKMKEILLEGAIDYTDCKDKVDFKGVEVRKKEKLHFLKDAFWDMIPKNCFYIDNKYVFFDQEWSEKYLPVEFIIYRSVINSYDLVRKINVDDLLECLDILQYKEYFEKLDKELREDIIDEEIYNEMYGKKNMAIDNLINDKKIAEMCLENEKKDNEKKHQYIQCLEEDNRKKQEYINKLEEDNSAKQEYIKMLEDSNKDKQKHISGLEKRKNKFWKI